MAATTTALSAYVPGTRAWFPDKDLGWIGATLSNKVSISQSGEVVMEFDLDEVDGTRVVKTTLDKLKAAGGEEGLPPLRNPPLLESTDDLTNLSYLNEPAGKSQEDVVQPSVTTSLEADHLCIYQPLSAPCHSQSIFAATHLHLLGYRAHRRQSLLQAQSVQPGDHPGIFGQASR